MMTVITMYYNKVRQPINSLINQTLHRPHTQNAHDIDDISSIFSH